MKSFLFFSSSTPVPPPEFSEHFSKKKTKNLPMIYFFIFPLWFQYHPPGQNPSHTPQMHGPKLPVESENKWEIFDYSKEN